MSKSKQQRIAKQNFINNTTPTGLNNNFIPEEVPVLRVTNAQNIIKGQNNSFVVLKRDSHAGQASGAGGRGFTQCGAIDIIAGLDSANGPHEKEREPNFFNDASRIYLTQKGKIDKYFGISKGSKNGDEQWRSGIGIKSDNVNIIGRSHVKIVTGKARVNGDERNSAGGSMTGAGKIDLIAGNFTGEEEPRPLNILGSLFDIGGKPKKVLQPIPKGDNLLELLTEILDQLSTIQGYTLDNRRSIIDLAINYSSHVHVGVCAAGPVTTTPSPSALGVIPIITSQFTKIPEIILNEINLGVLEENYLNSKMPDYINSRNVNTT